MSNAPSNQIESTKLEIAEIIAIKRALSRVIPGMKKIRSAPISGAYVIALSNGKSTLDPLPTAEGR